MEKERLLLSIVIPVYNLNFYIRRCLDSLINQDVDRSLYEIICIDDGSQDGSAEILDDYKIKHENIKVLHTENRGVVLARSLGLDLAQGKYIWFVDGDDWIKENCLKYLFDIVSKGENDLLLFREIRTSEYLNEVTDFNMYVPQYHKGGYKTFESHYTTGSGFYWFSKEILDEHKICFRPDVYYSDDTLFIAKFKARCRNMVITEAPIYYYFQREDSVSHAVNYSKHCGCMYKLAKEYDELSKQYFEFYDGTNINKRMKNAKLRSMQSCIRDIIMFCKDKKFFITFIEKSKTEGLYPFGIDFKQFKIDKKQGRKADLLNWIFGFISFELYMKFIYIIWTPIRKKKGVETFEWNDFEEINM